MEKNKTLMSKFAIARLIASGALLGIILAGMFGVDLSMNSLPGVVSGAAGAGGSLVLLKILHVL